MRDSQNLISQPSPNVGYAPAPTGQLPSNEPPSSTAGPLPPGSAFSRKTVWLTVILTLLALGLRFYHLSHQSLWIDELYSLTAARVPLGDVYLYSTKFNSMPTFSLLLKASLPESNKDIEWSARCLSALAGTLSVPVFVAIVYFWWRRAGVALLAGLLLAVNPLHIWYSQETRAYALMLFFGLLTILFLELHFYSRRSEWLTLYLLSALAAISLHRTALVFPALCLVWHVLDLCRQRKSRREIFQQLLIHVPLWVAALALMLIKLNPSPERAGSVLQFGYSFMTFLGGYSFGPSLNQIQSSGPMAALSASWLQSALLLLVFAAVAWAGSLCWRRLLFTKAAALLLTGFGVVAAYSAVSGFAYNVRYVLPALFGFLALLAGLVVLLPNRPQVVRLLTLAVITIALWADAQWYYSLRYRKPDSRAVAQWLVDNKSCVKSWTLLPEHVRMTLYWYLCETDPDVTKGDLSPTNRLAVPDVLMLQRRDQVGQPDEVIGSYLKRAGEVVTNRSFAGFELYVKAAPSSRP